MFDHVTIRVTDRPRSERFYSTVLNALGIDESYRTRTFSEWQDFLLTAADDTHPPTRHLHLAFVAPSRAHVDGFWQAGTASGHSEDGAPGPRPQYSEDYYGAFLLDPDGNSIEAVHHADTRAGGHIDHLWIGVSDLARAEAFYTTIARCAGLRPGSRWEGGVQVAGAWATFSLIADGRAPTTGLHLAFPAPDRVTVTDFHRGAVAAGYRDHGAPGLRPHYGEGYFAAYVLDPDGTNVESVLRGGER
jgi:catechol 2,3-dioxygenase-like lactoylglutathione lyase family enzyme